MPAQYMAVAESRLIVVSLRGMITKEEALALYKALVREPFLGPGTEMLVRASGVVTDMSPHEIREQAHLLPRLAGRGLERIAIAAEKPLVYGLARFFSAFAEVPDCHVSAFHTEEEALTSMDQDEKASVRSGL